MSTLSDMLAQTGGKSAKFEQPGDTITGQVVATDVRQTRDIKTGEPQTWDDGNPKQQVVITLQTTERDAADPDDNGERNVYVKWWGVQRQSLQQAVKESGAADILPGGTFTATYTGDGEQKQKGFNAPKLYTYTYQPPSATAGLLGSAETTAAATTPAPAPAAAPAPAPVAPAPAAPVADPVAAMGQITTLIKTGLTDAQIAAALATAGTDISQEAVAAVRSTLASV